MSETYIDPEKIEIKSQIDKMFKGGQIKKAIELCKSELEKDPTNSELHIRLGDLYMEWHLDIYQPKNYLDETLTEYQRALESSINSKTIHYKMGTALYHKGDLDKALSHLNFCIEYDSKMAEAYYMIAKVLVKKDYYGEAFENLEKAIRFGKLKISRAHYLIHLLYDIKSNNTLKSKFMSLWHLLISALTVAFDRDAQKDIFRKLSYLTFIPVFVKGYYLEKTRNVYRAIELYSQAIDRAPRFLPFYILLGDVYKSIGKIGDAINEYRMALWLDPLNITAYRSLCVLYEEQGDYDNATLMYKKLIEMHPNDAIYYSNMANLLYLKGKFDEAIACYQTAVTLNPNRTWTSVIAQTMGYIFQESKENHDAAISAYQSAFLLNPSDIDIYISLGSAFYDKGDYNNALTVYRTALEIAPDNARIHCNLGYLLWGKGLLDESIKEYEIAIKLDLSYDIAYNNLGVIYLDDLGYVQKALDMFEQAAKYNPNYALAHYNMGRAMSIKGNNVEAARLYQIALDLNSYTNELDPNEIKSRIDNLFD
jgi:tetratricopeptide (TPR) repeat protein